MYIINEYQLFSVASNLYISHNDKGAKISNSALANLLKILQKQEKLELSSQRLAELAVEHRVDLDALKDVLITKLNVLKPMLSRKFPLLYINSDDVLVKELLSETLNTQYTVEVVSPSFTDYQPDSLLIFYRSNYSSPDFKHLYHHLPEKVHLVTAGAVHKLLVIDNLYLKNSGLPSHFSNLHQLIAYLKSEIPATKNNWLLFYRELFKAQVETFPDSALNACQKGYIAYCLYQFLSQYTNLWTSPTPMDQLNWFWHADLTNFSIHTEVAVHSPYSEFDMKLNLAQLSEQELS